MIETLIQTLNSLDTESRLNKIEEIKEALHRASDIKQPVGFVRWVDINLVSPNDYNPNSVAKKEMGLLYVSIKEDGYTQPIVTIYNEEKGKFVIVDGFHRYYTAKSNPDILARNHGRVPIVVIEKDINNRMAATVRHNRARGKHSVDGMANMVFEMLEHGWSDSEICNKLGMEAEEIAKLKHITGFSKLFENIEYNKAWKTKRQLLLEKEYRQKNT